MAKAPKTISRASDLIQDGKNANRGTERGGVALADSIKSLGLGRSVVVDSKGVLIAGNKTVKKTIAAGIEGVILVPTDGKKLVVVQRTDLDLDSKKDDRARRLATADNRIGEIDLDWDAERLLELKEEGFDLEALGFNDAEITPEDWEEHWVEMPEYEQEDLRPTKSIVVHFASVKHLKLFGALLKQQLTEKTKSIWFPKAPNARGSGERYVGKKKQK